MSDQEREALELLATALRVAEFLMRGRRWRDYGPDDLAQDAVCRFLQRKKERPDEQIEHPKALLKRMVNDLYLNAAEKRERRERLDAGIPPPSDHRSLAEAWEEIEEARERLVYLNAKNDIQRAIITHTIRGFDIRDPEDLRDVLSCIGIDRQRFAVELHRLLHADHDEPAEKPIPRPRCRRCKALRTYRVFFNSGRLLIQSLMKPPPPLKGLGSLRIRIVRSSK